MCDQAEGNESFTTSKPFLDFSSPEQGLVIASHCELPTTGCFYTPASSSVPESCWSLTSDLCWSGASAVR